jgi:hypothetical protein
VMGLEPGRHGGAFDIAEDRARALPDGCQQPGGQVRARGHHG